MKHVMMQIPTTVMHAQIVVEYVLIMIVMGHVQVLTAMIMMHYKSLAKYGTEILMEMTIVVVQRSHNVSVLLTIM